MMVLMINVWYVMIEEQWIILQGNVGIDIVSFWKMMAIVWDALMAMAGEPVGSVLYYLRIKIVRIFSMLSVCSALIGTILIGFGIVYLSPLFVNLITLIMACAHNAILDMYYQIIFKVIVLLALLLITVRLGVFQYKI